MSQADGTPYALVEQARVINELYEFFCSTAVITEVEYVRLINTLGAGMATKLRLSFDQALSSRLAHLYELVLICRGEAYFFDSIEILSFEGLNPVFSFDCDLIFERFGTTWLVDATATDDHSIIQNKERVLEEKSKDPSLYGRTVETLVHRFTPNHFKIAPSTMFPSLESEEPYYKTLKILEHFNKRNVATREAFHKQCDEVYTRVIDYISNLTASSKNFDTSKSSSSKVDIAIKAVSTNTAVNNCELFHGSVKKQYEPFVDALKLLTAQSYDLKEPFYHREAALTESNLELESVLKKLDSDYLAKCLYSASVYDTKVAAVKTNGQVEYLDSFPSDSKNSKCLSYSSGYLCASKRIKGHYFEIKLSYEFMDKNMRRIIFKEKESSIRVDKSTKSTIEAAINKIQFAEHRLKEITATLNKRTNRASHSTIWEKFITIANLSKNDAGNVGKTSGNLVSSVAFTLSKMSAGCLISHLYEITKTFAASIKNSHHGQVYYVGINGPYESITISKMNSTQDSFNRSHYCVISKDPIGISSNSIVRGKHFQSGNVSRSSFRTFDNNEIAYNVRIPFFVISLLTWDIESNLDKGKFTSSYYPEMITSSVLHTLVNKDTFAQSAQQVRYLYTSSIGFGADPSKIVGKFSFFTPSSIWEFIYVYRMIKLGLSLSIIRDNNSVSSITHDGLIQVAFPHSTRSSKTFSHTVSSMYYCNIFNKFRAFHEISEAFCYNELDEENEIYEQCKKSNFNAIVGFSAESQSRYDDDSYILSGEFVQTETQFCIDLISDGPGRFKASVPFIIAASRANLTVTDSNIGDIYYELGKSPIDACTMRGAMSKGKSTDKGQGVRAASAILEELIAQYEIDSDALNKNTWLSAMFLDKIRKEGGDSSLYSLVVNQLCDFSINYIYRVVQKDQIGSREISVLNAAFRLGALFVEKISRCLSNSIKNIDLLEDPDKDYVFETAVVKTIENSEDNVICYDNTDQTRWGPNHMLHFFAAMFSGVLAKERGILRLILFIAGRTLEKKAKFPESLIKLFTKYVEQNRETPTINREGIIKEQGSDTLNKFYSNHSSDLHNNVFDKVLSWGMCQGIYHATSSVFHAIMCKTIEQIVSVKYGKSVSIRSFCTSDDSSRIIVMHKSLDRMEVIKFIKTIIVSVGCLMNVIRGESKSSFNFHVAEFNSIFFLKGKMATPSLKQRVAKIDVGSGSNHVEDYMTALSSAANYFTIGGSYCGAYILTIVNLTLHTEQWTRWKFATAEHYTKPVELGGFPVIEPFSTCLSGAASNLFLRSADYVKVEEYCAIFSSIITEKPEEFTLSDYFRVPKSISEDANSIKIFKNSGALGIFSLVRTDKKLSQFEKRHRMSQWKIPEDFLTLKHDSPDSRYFVYNIYKNGTMSLFSESEGVNSFYKRFTDPWLSKDRACFKISKRSILSVIGLKTDTKVSYSVIDDKLLSIDASQSSEFMSKISSTYKTSEFTKNLIQQLIPRMEDATSITNYLKSQECESYIEPKYTPATSRISLRGHNALDREKYTADLIKVLSGEKSRTLISEYYGNHRVFDTLPSSDQCPNINLKDSILIAQNSVYAFDKYIKRNTKMVTSGRPTNITSLVTKILESRFFEPLGVHLTGKLNLIGDRSHAFSYTNWFKELTDKSRNYINTSVNNNLNQTYADVVKYGIVSEKKILTVKDHFEVIDVPTTKKHVKLSAKSRSLMNNFVKSWISADVNFSFDYESLRSLYSNKLTNNVEYKTSDTIFCRSATGIYSDITVNGLPSLHYIEVDVSSGRPVFNHVIITESASKTCKIGIDVKPLGHKREWFLPIANYMRSSGVLILDRTYRVKQDSLKIISLNISTEFDIDIPTDTMTICAILPNFRLPISHANPKSVNTLSRGFKLDHNTLAKASIKFSDMLDETEDFSENTDKFKAGLNFILYKFDASSKLKNASDVLLKLKFPFKFESIAEIDVFKALLLDDKTSTKVVHTSKLYQYINNMFTSPNTKDNYLQTMSIEDRIALDRTLEEDEIPDNPEGIVDFDADITFEDIPEQTEVKSESLDEESDEPLFIIDDDSIDFDEFDLEDTFDENEALFDAIGDSHSFNIEETSVIQTSRTGITVNPTDEFPYAILSFIQKWKYDNKPKQVLGLSFEMEDITDITRIYLTQARLGNNMRVNLLKRYFSKESIELPCYLSDLSIIKSNLSS